MVGGIVAFRAVRGGAAVVLIAGGGLSLVSNLVWMGFTVGRIAGLWDYGFPGMQVMFAVMRFGGTLSMLMIAVGVLMLGFVLAGTRRQIQAMEQMLAMRSEEGEG